MEATELIATKRGERWGFKDARGDMAIGAIYDAVGSFSEGLAGVRVGKKWGFIDASGAMAIEPTFDQARFFQDGRAKVKLGGIWQMIDRSGRILEQLTGDTYLDKEGKFISEKEHRDWGKPPHRIPEQ